MRIPLKKYNKGMTLVELLVVLSIFAIISMTVAFNYDNYKSTTSTSVLSQDVALSIREAQGYAIGVRSVNTIFTGYGIHFSVDNFDISTVTQNKTNNLFDFIVHKAHALSQKISGDSKSFVLFADVPLDLNDINTADGKYNYNDSSYVCGTSSVSYGSECITVTSISGTDKILGFCINSDCDGEFSISDQSKIKKGVLDIVFRRPNPDAYFCYIPAGSMANSPCTPGVSNAGVIVVSEADNRVAKRIIVWNTGQISIK